MPPKPKVQLDKGAWQWAETTDPTQVTEEHVRTAYRLNLATCQRGACKRNCKGNPLCLNSLGEKIWFQPLDENKLQTYDHDEERRQAGHFVGLKNLGATCYVNTFLQLWFHNPAVRKALYEWRDPALPDQYYPGWKPDSICGHLQVIFALLHGSTRCYVDPSHLIECLGLNTAEQQDAQEFSKLFLHVLETALSTGAPGKENVIEKQFCGSYCYVTVCQNCKSESERPATFYELDLNIRGHSTLAASIKDFLQEEKLEGDNQYMCSVCNSKQNAKRFIRLKRLPEVLNLQLLRFVFDKNKGHKKKLSSFIQFPEMLDMSQYLQGSQEAENQAIYELSAVLIHRGPTAYSGHYIAHIREQETGAWFKFNDEEIEKMNNRKLELGKEEDNMESGSEKAPKASKGNHSSRNAYMLVYHRKGQGSGSDAQVASNCSESDLPAAVKGYVENDNQDFENFISEQLHVQEQSISDQKQTHEEMRAICEQLLVKSFDEPWEWVTTQWLTNWLGSPAGSDKVKNKISLCPHGKLRADDVVKMKCISGAGAEMLFSKYTINQRFQGVIQLCEKCVVKRCREIRTRMFMADDDKVFSSIKNIFWTDENEKYYWVSRKHLRSWKRFAIGEIDAQPISVSVPLASPNQSAESEGMEAGSITTTTSGKSECWETVNTNNNSSGNNNNNDQGSGSVSGTCKTQASSLAVVQSSHVTRTSSHSEVRSPLAQQSSYSPSSAVSPCTFSSTPPQLQQQNCSEQACQSDSAASGTIASSKLSSSLSPFGSTITHSSHSEVKPSFQASPFLESDIASQSSSFNSISPMDTSCANLVTACRHNPTRASDSPATPVSSNPSYPQVAGASNSRKRKVTETLESSASTKTGFSCLAQDSENPSVSRDSSPDHRQSPECLSVWPKSTGSASEWSDERRLGEKSNGVEHSVQAVQGFINGEAGGRPGDEGVQDDGASCSNAASRMEEEEEEAEERFNDDILCVHGNLKIDASGRRLVPAVVWDRLLYYFPHLKPFTQDADICSLCWREQEVEQQLKDSLKQEKQGQKELLQNLYHGKNRPRMLDPWGAQTAYVVCTSFIEGWRKFVKHSMVNDSVQEIVNAPLLCQHKLLVYKPEDMDSPENVTRSTLVWEEEWLTLTRYYAYDVVIQVIQLPEVDNFGRFPIVTVPEVCKCCLEERLKQEEEGKFLFTSQTIYIRKVLEGATGEATGDRENGKGYNYDPEFNAPPHQKVSKGKNQAEAPPEKQTRVEGGGSSSLRKSTRHRKTRGEKELTVSSNMTLKQLQKELFKLYSVLPMDQNLSLDGRSLNNVEATLQDLRVYPQCVIFLMADEPSGQAPSAVDDYLSVPTAPESGFKGTNLLGR